MEIDSYHMLVKCPCCDEVVVREWDDSSSFPYMSIGYLMDPSEIGLYTHRFSCLWTDGNMNYNVYDEVAYCSQKGKFYFKEKSYKELYEKPNSYPEGKIRDIMCESIQYIKKCYPDYDEPDYYPTYFSKGMNKVFEEKIKDIPKEQNSTLFDNDEQNNIKTISYDLEKIEDMKMEVYFRIALWREINKISKTKALKNDEKSLVVNREEIPQIHEYMFMYNLYKLDILFNIHKAKNFYGLCGIKDSIDFKILKAEIKRELGNYKDAIAIIDKLKRPKDKSYQKTMDIIRMFAMKNDKHVQMIFPFSGSPFIF